MMSLVRSLAFRTASAWRRSLWVLPALVVLAGVALAWVLALVDPGVSALQSVSPRIFSVSPDSARGVLTAIATSMLGVAGVVFSITIATLSLTSLQFTSRVLRTFVRDRGNQLVLGAFLGVFAYCLVVLRFVSSPSEGLGYAPELAVLVGIGLAFVGVGFLIYFIDHVAGSIQASTIISRIAGETIRVLGQDGRGSEGPIPDALRLDCESGACVVHAHESDYVREVDLRSLGELAAERGWRIRLLTNVGRFAAKGDEMLCVADDAGGPCELSAEEERKLLRAVRQSPAAEIQADPGFGVRQLVDIALKGLSSGVNDVTTALTCIDYLGAVLLVAHEHDRSHVVWSDEDGTPRVVAPQCSFEDLLGQAFDQIRENGAAQMVALLRLLDALERLERYAQHAQRRAQLSAQVRQIMETARRGLSSPSEQDIVGARAALLLEKLAGTP
jgi:uncharacterized membrane protein